MRIFSFPLAALLLAACLLSTAMLPGNFASAQEGLDLELEMTLDSVGKHREEFRKLSPNEKREFLMRTQKWMVTDYHRATPIESRIESALDDETQVEFIDTPLTDVLEFMSDLHNIPIVLDQNAIKSIGVNQETAITANLKSISCRSALRLILNPLQLDFLIENQTLKVTTIAVTSSTMQTRVYETRRFMHLAEETIAKAIRAGVNPDSWRDDDARSGGEFGDGEFGGSEFGGGELGNEFGDEFGAESGLGAENEFEGAVVRNRSRKATLTIIPGGLVIRQTQRNHELIADLLSQLDSHHSNPLYDR